MKVFLRYECRKRHVIALTVEEPEKFDEKIECPTCGEVAHMKGDPLKEDPGPLGILPSS